VRVQLPGGTPGDLVKAVGARVRDATGVLQEARATALARTVAVPPLIARAVLNRDPLRPTPFVQADIELALLDVVVANTSAVPIPAVALELRIPFEIYSIGEINLEGAGNCLSGTLNMSCEPGEYAAYDLGTLQPGQARTITYPIAVQDVDAWGGTLLTANADVRVAGVQGASASTAIVIDDAPVLDLVLDAAGDPSASNGTLDLVLSFGNEGASTRELQLALPLPAGTSLVSASNGGELRNGAVRWNTIQTPSQQGGTRRLRLQLPPGSGLLDLLAARIFDVAAPYESARVGEVVQLEPAPPLALAAAALPNPAGRGAALDVDLTATNRGGVALTGVAAALQTPDQINAINEAVLGGAGCASGSLPTFCTVGELLTWNPVQLDPLASSTFSLPPVVGPNSPLGSHIRFRGRVLDSVGNDAIASVAVRVGSLVDTDADGVQQLDDNCPLFANPDQQDTDLDGRGNACECGDQNLDGQNTVSDLVAINLAIFNPGLASQLCDANNDGDCNVSDIVHANIEIFSPGSTSTCARQPVPGP
jgi:hypothetical protein